MPTRGGHETRAERHAREMVEALEPTARKELSAMLMTKRLDRALAIGEVDVTSQDLAAVMRVLVLEAMGMYYRARAEGGVRGIDLALRGLGEARKALMDQAALLGQLGPKSAPGAAPGAEAGPGGEQIQALLRHVLRTDPRFERAYLAAAAGKSWQEVLEGETIEVPATKVS